ncbi:MAG: biliverdin-producing heme oxygenase [Candidatus Methylumidiphilus sp.]
MNHAIPSQSICLMDELKASTHAFHEQLQEAPFFKALSASRLPVESYISQLQALAVIHAVLEHEIERSQNDALAAVWQPDMCKLPALMDDLSYFEPRHVSENTRSVGEALKIAEAIRLHALQEPLALLGYIYVLEGSMLGAQILMPKFSHAFKLTKHEGLSYLNSYGSNVAAHWSSYCQRMNALMLDKEGRGTAIKSACGFFEQMEAVFLALYPIQSNLKGRLATAINPEAGRHPIPIDQREIQAASEAALLCWQQFPYFALRYGERGFRFAKSDGAWLVTLYQFDQHRIDQQVHWLGRVLSARGMPTLLLQLHLEILVDRLVTAISEKQASYQKLLLAASSLREKRCNQIDDACLYALNQEFNQSVGPVWSERLGDAGLLLVAAMADELNGNLGAVNSMSQWMSDATRFDAKWINAVEETFAKAQAYAQIRKS